MNKKIISRLLITIGLTISITGLGIATYNSSTTHAISLEDLGLGKGDQASVSLAKQRGISYEEAHKRIEWQNKAGALHDRLEKKVQKSDFGGMWIDKDSDRVKIGALNGSLRGGASRSTIEQEITNDELAEAVDFVAVKHSYAALKEVKQWISQAAQEKLAGTKWPIQVGITTDKNKVLIHIPENKVNLSEAHTALLNEIQSRFGDMVETITYRTPPIDEAACNSWFCNSPLRGGVGLKGNYEHVVGSVYDSTVTNYEDGTDCTAGFNAVGSSGTKYVITAGHCGRAGVGWATETYGYTTKKIGAIHNNLYGQNGIDAMIIEIKEAAYDWDVAGKIYTRAGIGPSWNSNFAPPSYNEAYDITDIGTSGTLVGERICSSGAISSIFEGGSCGPVWEVDIDLEVNGVVSTNIVRAGYCSRQGDSGGPIFRSGKALGIHKARDDGYPTCSNFQYYTGMKPIIYGFGNNISIF